MSFELPNPETGDEKVVATATTDNTGVATVYNVSLADFPAGISPNAVLAVFAGDATHASTAADGNLTSNEMPTPNTIINLSNGSGDVDDALNNGEIFQTSFLGDGDVTIQQTASNPPNNYNLDTAVDFTTTATSGNTNNNPPALTGFVGNPAQGTGNGTPGSMYSLIAGDGDSFQINFNNVPIGPSSEILLGDIDGDEMVNVQAFDGTKQVSLSNWAHPDLTGENTGSTPSWATWNVSSDGFTVTFKSSTSGNQDDEINELTPHQNVTELDLHRNRIGGRQLPDHHPGVDPRCRLGHRDLRWARHTHLDAVERGRHAAGQ